MRTAFMIGCLFGEQRSRRRDVSAHRLPHQHEASDDYPRCRRKNQDQHPEGIKQHVVLLDALAPEQIAQPRADQGTDAGGNRIGAERRDQPDQIVVQVIGVLLQRQRYRARRGAV